MQIDKEKIHSFLKGHGEPIVGGIMGIGAAIALPHPLVVLFFTYLGIRRYYMEKEKESK